MHRQRGWASKLLCKIAGAFKSDMANGDGGAVHGVRTNFIAPVESLNHESEPKSVGLMQIKARRRWIADLISEAIILCVATRDVSVNYLRHEQS